MQRQVYRYGVAVVALSGALGQARPASAEGPFVELHPGLSAPLLTDAAGDAALDAGVSWGGALGLTVQGPLSFELWAQGLALGDASLDGGVEAREWRAQAITLGARYEPLVLLDALRLEAIAAFGVVVLDVQVEDAALADLSARALAPVLGARATWEFGAGLYAGLDLRWLLTASWEDRGASGAALEFRTLPLVAAIVVGWRLDLYGEY